MRPSRFVLTALVFTLAACSAGGQDSDLTDTDPAASVDADGDGVSAADDCDDDDASVGAATSAWADVDVDGYGDPASPVETCTPGQDSATNDADCDDTNPEVYPSAVESCNGVDDNCDGAVDEGGAGGTTWYADADGDGYGDPATGHAACDAPLDHVDNATDCDDTSGAVSPGAAEVPYDGVDNDCNGTTPDDDLDADGWTSGDDCDDRDPRVNPEVAEVCDDETDNNCDGAVDESCARGFQFTDTRADDVSDTSLYDYFASLRVSSTDYISFSISGSSTEDGQWCAERADWYASNYMTYAPSSSTSATSGSWQKWSRTEGGAWSVATTTGYTNYYGSGCDSYRYSWCSEWGLGGLHLLATPANTEDGESYATDWSAGAGWEVEIFIASTRMEACGF